MIAIELQQDCDDILWHSCTCMANDARLPGSCYQPNEQLIFDGHQSNHVRYVNFIINLMSFMYEN
jgi:hypothetical protein